MRTNYVTCPTSDKKGIELEIARHKTSDDARAFLERLAKKNNTKVEFENPHEDWEKAFGKKWPPNQRAGSVRTSWRHQVQKLLRATRLA